MQSEIIFTLKAIQIDFFTGFGLYTLVYFFISLFSKNPLLKKVDKKANAFISFSGLIYLVVWLIGIVINLNVLNKVEKSEFLNWMFGKYWFGFWIQPLLWVFITQLLRIKIIQKNFLIRLIICFLLTFSIERMVIILVSFHRDYLPSSWNLYNDLDIYPSNYLLALLLKIIIFLLYVGIYCVLSINLKKCFQK